MSLNFFFWSPLEKIYIYEIFRIPKGKSYFDKEPERVSKREDKSVPCECQASPTGNSELVCPDPKTRTPGVRLKDAVRISAASARYFTTTNNSIRKKRSVPEDLSDVDDEEDDVVFVNYDFNYGSSKTFDDSKLKWPTPSGITEANASNVCDKKLLSAKAAKGIFLNINFVLITHNALKMICSTLQITS